MKFALLLAAVAVSLASSAAQAQDAPGVPSAEMQKRYQACKADAMKLCAAEVAARQAGTGDRSGIGKCLDSHAAELSEGCKAARAERAAEKAKTGQ